MHPPPFHIPTASLTGSIAIWRSIAPGCLKSTDSPVKLLRASLGYPMILDAVRGLTCQTCKFAAAPVYLCGSHHRTFTGATEPDLELEPGSTAWRAPG